MAGTFNEHLFRTTSAHQILCEQLPTTFKKRFMMKRGEKLTGKELNADVEYINDASKTLAFNRRRQFLKPFKNKLAAKKYRRCIYYDDEMLIFFASEILCKETIKSQEKNESLKRNQTESFATSSGIVKLDQLTAEQCNEIVGQLFNNSKNNIITINDHPIIHGFKLY
ncbi:hypothetical protein Trydic_g16635 [Trypoxylus dichotomus]